MVRGGGSFFATDSDFTNCATQNAQLPGMAGGALHAEPQSIVTIDNSTFHDCSTSGLGGALHISTDSFIMAGATLTDCVAQSGGGVAIGDAGSFNPAALQPQP